MSFTPTIELLSQYRVALLCVFATAYVVARARRAARLPPGPRGLPLLGNVLQLGTHQWVQMAKWSKQYGPIYSLNFLGKPAIVISSHKVAADLLDKRSAIYSDRPRLIMTGEVLSGSLFFAFLSYGDAFKKLRRAAWEGLNPRASEDYLPIQEREAVLLVEALSQDSEHWSDHVKREIASITLSFSYSLPPLTANDPLIKRVATFDHTLEEAARPGAYLVEIFPWLNYFPVWMSKWKQDGNRWHEHYSAMFLDFYRDAKKRAAAEECGPCVSSVIMKNKEINEKEAAWVAGTLFATGSSTTSAAQHVFILAMLLFPDVMRKAQAQIDEVVGRDRLPNAGDRAHLPYIRAMVRETLRWKAIGPLGLPHELNRDDVYEGYLIPKGAMVFYNLWAMNSDPEVYPEPERFRPERFLDETEITEVIPPNTHGEGHLAFGYGRRTCVGNSVTNNTLFLNIATLLWAFNIQKAKDKNGTVITPDVNNFVDHVNVNHPAPFPASFVYRHSDVPHVLASSKSERMSLL
ncbi:cytochrome P450 [Cristinia sonorae]|uniref:Cytochrome P450 n=1 Tax=Cristinia sonorae TaxID=1940300 RepID=A0A8K0XUW3_9AGAR|nr:cytochrome P450 [Cristinia sonorae]